jgi:hypothetical protein
VSSRVRRLPIDAVVQGESRAFDVVPAAGLRGAEQLALAF